MSNKHQPYLLNRLTDLQSKREAANGRVALLVYAGYTHVTRTIKRRDNLAAVKRTRCGDGGQ